MIYTKKIQEAIQFAIQVHELDQKQKRKGKDVPYLVHPLAVGLILAGAGATEDVIVAGILHDTIEDSVAEKKITREIIAEKFGEGVAEIVDSVTEQNKSLSWIERKEKAHVLISEYSYASVLVKSADIISNTNELIGDYDRDDEATFSRFNAPRGQIIGHQLQSMTSLINRCPDSPLAADLAEARIKLMKIDALGNSYLSYMEWNYTFIEHEMKYIYSDSKFYDQVNKFCSDAHQIFRDYEIDGDVKRFNEKMFQMKFVLQVLIKDIEKSEKYIGPAFLLKSYLPDVLANEGDLISIKLKNGDEIMQNIFLAAYEVEGSDWHVPVFIVNTNFSPVVLALGQHSIQSDDDSVLDLGMSKNKIITISAHGFVEIDRMTDGGELDFTTEYWVTYVGKRYLASISGSGLYFGASELEIPVLKKDWISTTLYGTEEPGELINQIYRCVVFLYK